MNKISNVFLNLAIKIDLQEIIDREISTRELAEHNSSQYTFFYNHQIKGPI